MSEQEKIEYPYFWADGDSLPISGSDKIGQWKNEGEKIVTTNGCFDLIHSGHINFLKNAKSLGSKLIVGLNSDSSVRKLKGMGKPILSELERATLLAALQCVDEVVVYNDDLPNKFLDLIKPHIHCKAADYSADSLPEAETVRKNGGEISILPLIEGISSSQIIEKIQSSIQLAAGENQSKMIDDTEKRVMQYFMDSSNLYRQTAYNLKNSVTRFANKVTETLQSGHKILICGNGGSAADSQHIAAEFVGRFKLERKALPAIALTTDTSVITAIGNDYGFEQVFSRQVAALGTENDLLIAISTSGQSKNVLNAVSEAKKNKMFVISLTGHKTSSLQSQSNLCLNVPSDNTALIQQAHIGILHIVCDIAEHTFYNSHSS